MLLQPSRWEQHVVAGEGWDQLCGEHLGCCHSSSASPASPSHQQWCCLPGEEFSSRGTEGRSSPGPNMCHPWHPVSCQILIHKPLGGEAGELQGSCVAPSVCHKMVSSKESSFLPEHLKYELEISPAILCKQHLWQGFPKVELGFCYHFATHAM